MRATARVAIDPVSLAVLVDPRPARAIDALRVALVALASAACIRIDATGNDTFVHVQQAPGPDTPQHIGAVYRVLADCARDGRLSRESAQQAFARAYGQRFRRYVKDNVAPTLVAHGMLRIETRRLLWLFSTQRMVRTETGEQAALRSVQQLAALETLPQLVDSDPARALRLARAAGPLLLLSPTARAAIPRLMPLFKELGPAAVSGAAYALIEETEPEWLDLLDHAEMVMSIEFDSLLSAIEAVADFGSDGSASSGTDSGADGSGAGGGD